MKILYVSQYFPPEMGAPAARVSELSRRWSEAGHDVTVLTGFPNHPTGVVRPEYRSRFRRLICREQIDGIKVVRTWLIPLPNRKPLERMLNYSSFCVSAAVAGTFVGRPDLVIGTSPQLLVGITGWWISWVKRVPFVLEIRDLWPESLAAVGVGHGRSLLYRGLARVAAFLYRACDHLVVVTSAFKDHISAHSGIAAEKISVVPNGVETEVFHPVVDNGSLRSELGLNGKFVVSYIGTLGMAHDLGTVLQAAVICAESMPDVRFLLVGAGADKEHIVAEVSRLQLGNVRILPETDRKNIPALVGASHACLVTLKRSDVFKTVIPTKMLEFMSCAKPVVLAVQGQASDLLNAARAGICIPPQDPGSMVEAIRRLSRDRDLCHTLGQNGRNYICENLSRARTADAYIGILKDVVGRRLSGVAVEKVSTTSNAFPTN